MARCRLPKKRAGRPARRGRGALALATGLLCAFATQANPLEADSTGNRLYVLLWHGNLVASLDGVGVGVSMPGFCSAATPIHVPGSVPADSARLAGFGFDVAAAAVGTQGDAVVTVTGTIAGTPVSQQLVVPLEVVSNAPPIANVDGLLGNEGGDTDGDGVADAVESHFGSDPFDASSMPGTQKAVHVPSLTGSWLAFLAGALLAAPALALALANRRGWTPRTRP